MNEQEWEYYRELEKQLIILQNQISRLEESNKALQRVNSFILSSIIVEMVILVFRGW